MTKTEQIRLKTWRVLRIKRHAALKHQAEMGDPAQEPGAAAVVVSEGGHGTCTLDVQKRSLYV